jgi:nucleoid DNA-binding protein
MNFEQIWSLHKFHLFRFEYGEVAKNFLIFVLTLRHFLVDITAFIRELLFGHDCVIVPGFGGFIGNYTPARIDKKSGTFYPPVKQISFNRNLNHNDGLLVGRISGTSGINYGDARSMVEEFVSEIRRKLEKGEKVVFDHIGSFINNQEGNIQFEPDRSSNYHLDSYGLESFQLSPLEGYNVRTRITRTASKDPERMVSMRKILWRAAVIVPLLSVLVIIPLKTDLFRSKVETTNMNPLVSAEFEQNKKAVDEEVKTEEAKTAENITAVVEAPPETVVAEPPVNEANVYFLITGSFKSEENAVTQVNTLKAQGFTPEIVVAPNGFFRVCALACSDMNTALSKKDSIAAEFPGAWISKKK